METAFVQEVAASLVREFLSKKGLKKTGVMMDQELPRTALSINNRNELRKILHLQPLYKLNKTRENPLKTILEIMTSYFLEETISLQEGIRSPAIPHNNSQLRGSETTMPKSSFSDGNTHLRMVPQTNQTVPYSCEIDEETAGSTFLSRRHRVENKKGKTGQASEYSPEEGEKMFQDSREELRTPELSSETRTAVREKLRTKPGLIIRGMMAGPTASFEEDSLKRRPLKRHSGNSNTAQLREEDNIKSSFGVPSDGFQETKGTAGQSTRLLSLHSGSSLDVKKEHSSKMLFDGRAKTSTHDENDTLGRWTSGRPQDGVRKSASSRDMEADEKSYWLDGFQRPLGDGSEKKERSPRKSETQFSDCRKTPTSTSRQDTLSHDALELVDVEDEVSPAEVCKIPDPSALFVPQVKSKPIDFCLARDLKILLFGSSLGCFSEEWKIQSFVFSDVPELKYGIVQKKGDPAECWQQSRAVSCDILSSETVAGTAAILAPEGPSWHLSTDEKEPWVVRVLKPAFFSWCVQKCHFPSEQKEEHSDGPRVPKADEERRHFFFHVRLFALSGSLRPSEAQRTKCLALALTDILWRTGGSEKATVTLCSGTQQFTPAGKYKADGILETITLYVVTKYEDLLSFLQQNIDKFEAGPYGGILLTLSAILSRSINQVRSDFDVNTNRLIGAHGYCTQELVNLLLTGKAVSNVFNDVLELDSGNGNATVLKGVSGRSEVGLLSLFEHYDVCQVGCYLKTPKFPIWLVCSESHFSVLFSTRKDLLGDWKTERRFDLYYYDGLANQQEEIRLSVDTSQPYVEDQDSDLIPPLEHCIRTKWKGAAVNWNGTEPIL